MSYTVWTGDIGTGESYIVLLDIPTFVMAENLLIAIREIYGDDIAWIEED